MSADISLSHRGARLRRLAAWGAQNGPVWFIRTAPAVLGVAFAIALPGMRRAVQNNVRWLSGEQAQE